MMLSWLSDQNVFKDVDSILLPKILKEIPENSNEKPHIFK